MPVQASELRAAGVDEGEVKRLIAQHKEQFASERDQIALELEAREREVRKAKDEKEGLQKKIQAMERQFLTGGAAIEESQEFHAAVADAEAKLRSEWVAALVVDDRQGPQALALWGCRRCILTEWGRGSGEGAGEGMRAMLP